MPKLKEKVNAKSINRTQSSKLSKRVKTKKGMAAFEIQAGDADEEAIKAFIEECFVPILAEQFMADQSDMNRRRKAAA